MGFIGVYWCDFCRDPRNVCYGVGMATNRRTQTKTTQYKLLFAGKEYGCYAELDTAKQIGRSLGGYYQIYHGDTLIDEN